MFNHYWARSSSCPIRTGHEIARRWWTVRLKRINWYLGGIFGKVWSFPPFLRWFPGYWSLWWMKGWRPKCPAISLHAQMRASMHEGTHPCSHACARPTYKPWHPHRILTQHAYTHIDTRTNTHTNKCVRFLHIDTQYIKCHYIHTDQIDCPLLFSTRITHHQTKSPFDHVV